MQQTSRPNLILGVYRKSTQHSQEQQIKHKTSFIKKKVKPKLKPRVFRMGYGPICTEPRCWTDMHCTATLDRNALNRDVGPICTVPRRWTDMHCTATLDRYALYRDAGPICTAPRRWTDNTLCCTRYAVFRDRTYLKTNQHIHNNR